MNCWEMTWLMLVLILMYTSSQVDYLSVCTKHKKTAQNNIWQNFIQIHNICDVANSPYLAMISKIVWAHLNTCVHLYQDINYRVRRIIKNISSNITVLRWPLSRYYTRQQFTGHKHISGQNGIQKHYGLSLSTVIPPAANL